VDVLWVGFVRLPSLLGSVSWVALEARGWIPELIALLLVPVEVYLAWRFFGQQYREKLAATRTSKLMDKVLKESTPWRWAIDAAGRFTHCGPESLDLVGYEPSELLGHHFSLLIDREDLAGLLQDRTSRADPDGSWVGVRTIYRHRHGGRVMVDVSARTRIGAEEEYLGLEGTTRSLGPGPIQDRSADETRRRVETVLEERHLSTAFQPIWSLKSGQVIGVEALTRFLNSPDSPDTHFSEADSVGLGAELEFLALETALDAARDLPDHLYVAVNLSPDACLDPRLPRVLSRSELPGRRIVLEVTERHAVEEYGPLARALASLRRTGLRIAVDDAGAGFASMRHILELTPDLIKLDRDVIAGIDTDPARQALGTAMVGFAAGIGASLVAEGIETAAELSMVTTMGMHAGQGYFLGRPSVDPGDWVSWVR
jgi:PAS domain S-box-containing protein